MKIPVTTATLVLAFALSSCDHSMVFHTKVNEDGSLDKMISFDDDDEKATAKNALGIDEMNGWKETKELKPQNPRNQKEKKEAYLVHFSKHFSSSEELNKELNSDSDTQFHLRSAFEKKNRWFYTYIKYSETVRPINRFKLVSPKDFFNAEDSSFINRLPSQGKSISKADSVYLEVWNEKLSERFVMQGVFKECYKAMEEVIRKNSIGNNWLDTLKKNRDMIYQEIEHDGQDDFKFYKIAKKLNIPLSPEKANGDFEALTKEFNSRFKFMMFAYDGKYQNEFEMPWTIIASNADSVAGNTLYWKPLVHKFIYMDYEMYAECRKMNWWAMAISAVVIGVTLFLLWKRK
jgi:hypothetical protein